MKRYKYDTYTLRFVVLSCAHAIQSKKQNNTKQEGPMREKALVLLDLICVDLELDAEDTKRAGCSSKPNVAYKYKAGMSGVVCVLCVRLFVFCVRMYGCVERLKCFFGNVANLRALYHQSQRRHGNELPRWLGDAFGARAFAVLAKLAASDSRIQDMCERDGLPERALTLLRSPSTRDNARAFLQSMCVRPLVLAWIGIWIWKL